MRLLGPCLSRSSRSSSSVVFIAFCFSYLKLPRRWEMLPRAGSPAPRWQWHGQVFCRFFPFFHHRRFSSRESDDCTRSEIYYGGAIVPQASNGASSCRFPPPPSLYVYLSTNILQSESHIFIGCSRGDAADFLIFNPCLTHFSVSVGV